MERKLRRYQNVLVCVGSGVIMFGFWGAVKSVMNMILKKQEIATLAIQMGVSEETVSMMMPFMFIATLIVVALDVTLRMIVGLSARREGRARDEKKHWAYLVFAVILAMITLSSLFTDIATVDYNYSGVLDSVITAVIDLTSFVMSIELFVTGVKVKVLKKKCRKAKAEEAAV